MIQSDTHQLHAGASTCPLCRRFWLVTPQNDCCVPACGCFGRDTGPDNPARPCNGCGIQHALACSEMPQAMEQSNIK